MNGIGVYPGSFNPWHEGHEDVLNKALKVFDKVIILIGYNPDKGEDARDMRRMSETWERLECEYGERIQVQRFAGLLVDEIKRPGRAWVPTAVIRGLRNGYDLQYEMNQQYWNEDLGLEIPVVFFITDRKLAHVSSSAIRGIRRAKGD